MSQTRIFPFAPGIPWELKYGKYIIPKISASAWQYLLTSRNIILTAPSKIGLLEAFYSLSLLEAFNYTDPGLKLSWQGPTKYHFLAKLNQLANLKNPLEDSLLKQFPLPLFFNKEGVPHFNCFNNYLQVAPYYGGEGYQDQRAVIKQIFEKSLLSWNSNFLPKLRRNVLSANLSAWLKNNKIYLDSIYILIIPDITTYSMHTGDCLGCSPLIIKELASMLAQIGVRTLVATTTPQSYYSNSILTLPFEPLQVMQLMPQAFAILSKEIDFLLLALALSKAQLITKKLAPQFKLSKNQKFLLKQDNQIVACSTLDTLTIFNSIQNKLNEYRKL